MEDNIAWMAGFFDGEGCIHIQRRKGRLKRKLACNPKTLETNLIPILTYRYDPIVAIGNCNRISLELFQNRFGGGIENCQTSTGRPFYRWYLDKKENIGNFIEIILPHSIIKQPQLLVMKSFLDLSISRTNNISEEEQDTIIKLAKLYQTLIESKRV